MKQYYMPVRILLSDCCVKENAALLQSMGCKALIVTGKHSGKLCGALDDVIAVLEANGQSYVLYNRVVNNPTLDCVYEGAAIAREQQVDFVIAIGGGSPMDAAKAMAMLAVCEIPKEEIFQGVADKEALPMLHIPTTAGTGSEVTPYAILTNDGKETKTSISAPSLFPKAALLDPRYLAALPRTSMIHTVMDSMSHSMEGMLSVRATEITDGMALQGIALIGSCLDRLIKDTLTKEDRKNLLLASTLGGMVISGTGTTIVHSMGYSLTYFHGADHGRANGLLLPAFLKVAHKSHPDKVKAMLQALEMDSIAVFDQTVRSLLGKREELSLEQIEKYTQMAKGSKNIPNCVVPITEKEIRQIFKESLTVKA